MQKHITLIILAVCSFAHTTHSMQEKAKTKLSPEIYEAIRQMCLKDHAQKNNNVNRAQFEQIQEQEDERRVNQLRKNQQPIAEEPNVIITVTAKPTLNTQVNPVRNLRRTPPRNAQSIGHKNAKAIRQHHQALLRLTVDAMDAKKRGIEHKLEKIAQLRKALETK